MAPTLTELGVDTLSTADRLALAEALWESVAADLAAQPIDPELRAELERRLGLADADPGRGIPWEQVRAAAEDRWQNRSSPSVAGPLTPRASPRHLPGGCCVKFSGVVDPGEPATSVETGPRQFGPAVASVWLGQVS